MLSRLTIQDLAIIDRLTLDFFEGFTVLTGETGAGKSIILGALNLVLGERASADVVRTGADTAQVEALFDLARCPAARRVVSELHLEASSDNGDNNSELIVRREISAQGRSRCLVNGRLVPLAHLSRLGDCLMDLHGQHQHQSLLKIEIHREILDTFGGDKIAASLETFRALFDRHRKALSRLRALNRDEREIERQKSLLEFQAGEIREARLEPGEDARLDEERCRLEHADALLRNAAEALDMLYEGERQEATIVDLLARCEETISASAHLDPSLGALTDRFANARAEIADLAAELRSYSGSLQADPERLAEVSDRLELLRRLKRKYGGTIEEILEAADAMEKELFALVHSREEQEALEAERIGLEKDLAKAAEALSARRREAAARFAKGLCRELSELEMPHVEFEVQLDRDEGETPAGKAEPASEGASTALEEADADAEMAGPRRAGKDGSAPAILFPDGKRYRVHEHGVDQVEFLISPNRGENLKPLRKIASGGELSRIMLALKVLMRGQDQVPTLVFDEIDTGISGRTGASVGEKMARLGEHCQVICITHLPQIAARAGRHYAVRKIQEKKRVLTRVEALEKNDRLSEIARLLGGKEDLPIARRHAKELLGG